MNERGTSRGRNVAPFVPANSSRKRDSEVSSQFAVRRFAAARAGFLLREYARLQETASPSGALGDSTTQRGAESDAIAPADANAETSPSLSGTTAVDVSTEEIECRIAEAEQRGREAGQAELVAALDHAIAALDAAGRAVQDAQLDLERRAIVPLAQASFHMGSELARQALADANGLQRYLATVTSAIQSQMGEEGTSASMAIPEVRLNPEDLSLLEGASVKPTSITLVADPLVPRAGAIVSHENKVVDDRFENRMRFAKEAVLAAAADLLREAPS
ncbi:MAG: hypothetical protein FJ196_05650 [Gammaproteobacteria bacterium]|nr:hypothetical protein [Gammaproteobacteria bacterium]